MLTLSTKQINQKIDFIKNYIHAQNAATGSTLDANANISQKNIATLEVELNKDINIQINRYLVKAKITELFSEELANEYERQINSHEIYIHDETSLKPYCASVSMYPFLLEGIKGLGGESKAPKNLDSFVGSFINLVFALSSQFAGALATVEFLMYFDYFARKELGDNYLDIHSKRVDQLFQQVVYSINQPAAARGYQSVFWNISIYDRYYFEAIFKDFVFPDYDKPVWKSVEKLQDYFMQWFGKERHKSLLTFPVVTAAMLTENKKVKDQNFAQLCAREISRGHSFFIYQSDSADSLASCCRLRNEISDNTFSYSLGAGGVSTGSINVITLNLSRMVQQKSSIKKQIEKIHKYQYAYRKIIEEYIENNMLPQYSAKFISLDKQFLTIGINGIVEAAESQGITPNYNPQYVSFVQNLLKEIYDLNKTASKTYEVKFNTEFVPAENLGVKNAQWDRESGLKVNRDCYNSYLYPVEDITINAVEKFKLHGSEIVDYLDGGSALHLNLEEHLSYKNALNLFNIAAQTGCNYFTTNVKSTICNECGHIDMHTLTQCPKCNSQNIDHATRVIGYLKRVSSFSSQRQSEATRRFYHYEHQQELQ